ncbi:uncharacterized protein LOC126844868 [Adelges cooleyi]|uniref:uncharacterized protein LOC126844868 n=1 Tax=Adelges cooleyi TaxID=133065 RepID=UPI00218072F4|nr:uncharacterized protein LOC126844868 [Adelges cooleyi]
MATKTIMRQCWTQEIDQFRVNQYRRSACCFLREKIIRCVDAQSYIFDIYSDFIVTIQNLAQKVFPECTDQMCFTLLYKYLKSELHRGNTERLEMMRKNGHLRNGGRVDEVSLAELIHINGFWQHQRRSAEQNNQECTGPPAKRLRLNWN